MVLYCVYIELYYYSNYNTNRFFDPEENLNYYKNFSVDNNVLYLVYNNKCRIPNLDIYNPDVLPFMKKRKFRPCTDKGGQLTYIQTVGNQNTLIIDYTKRNYYAIYGKISCCYSVVHRRKHNDNSYLIDNCTHFEKTAVLNSTIQFLIVKCERVFRNGRKKIVYAKAHAIITTKHKIRKRLDSFKQNDTTQPISVLMIVFDSVSRLNFYRAMPKTANYILSKGWFPLRAFNKVGLNTYPNIMAMMTGYNISQVQVKCNNRNPKRLDKCPLILYKYRGNGYVTAYGEDDSSINSFSYAGPGFLVKPTDYYIHQSLNDVSLQDSQTKLMFNNLENSGLFNKSIVIFMSDHGMRFGGYRKTYSGWLEDRLPFIFIWLPDWFRKKFPTAVKNLKLNENRLTTAFDLHLTLQDILKKSGRLKEATPSLACPKCKSLFEEIPFERGCEDASIDFEWCTCNGFHSIDNNIFGIDGVAEILVKRIQKILSKSSETRKLCKKPSLKSVIDVRESQLSTATVKFYLVTIEIDPSGKFEGTIVKTFIKGKNSFELKGDVTRIDSYGTQSHCIHTKYYKPYCYCKEKL
ncbi:uncharacterized protein LOC123298859 [Chrysoperla carnea]|uniref:uncharacterized protein LOC123298859 n=1 Tax=Chrysoperla carnea TaxID=189513 RepID=UPI001D086082|nr:uncharacterized protein LOC123298859 [Chrysoperla carnea]